MSNPDTSMRQALLRLLRGEPADRPVWIADLTYWMAAEKTLGRGDPAWEHEEGFLAFHQNLGVMPYYYYEKMNAFTPVEGSDVEECLDQQGPTTTRTFRTPIGEIHEISTYMPGSFSTGIVRHFVQDGKDLNVLRYILDRRRLTPNNLDDYAERMKLWASYDGLPVLGMPRSPLASLLTEWAGVQNGVYLLMDYEQEVREIFAVMEALEAPVLEAVCKLAPPLVHFPDNLSSENVAGLYDEWMAPTHRRRLERLHAADIRAAVHLDGTTRGLLPKLAAAGFDAIEALTPKPVGDLDLDEMRSVAGNTRTVLWGGVPGAMFAPPYTWDDMEAHLHRLLKLWSGTPFVIGVADQVLPNGDISFCRKIADILRG